MFLKCDLAVVAGVGAPIPTAATALYLVLARQSAEWNPDAAIFGPTNEPANHQPDQTSHCALVPNTVSLAAAPITAAGAMRLCGGLCSIRRRGWRVPFVGGRPNRLTTATGCRWAVAFASSRPSICLDYSGDSSHESARQIRR